MLSLSSNNLFGLDISDFALRLVKIETSGGRRFIVSQNEIEVPKDSMVNGEIKKPDALAAAIKKLVTTAKGKKVRTNLVVSVLPEPKTFIKLLQVASPTMDELPQHLVHEMEKHIPYAMDEIYFDWQILGEFKPKKTMNVLVGASPIVTVDSFISVLKSAGLTPAALEIESAAITRAILSPEKEKSSGAKIIIDMGAARTSLIVYDKNAVQFTMSLPLAGNDITKKIAEKLEINLKQAEKAKRICGLDKEKCKGALRTVLTDSMNKLLKKIEEAVKFYEEESGKQNVVKEILLCGNGSTLLSLDMLIQNRFQVAVTRADTLTNITKISKGLEITDENILSYTTAIGLALRSSD